MKTITAQTDASRATITADVLVIGGGVIGSSIAYHLARQGRSVLVVERQEIAARPAASWASAGGIRPQGLHPAEVALARLALAHWAHLADELADDLHYRAHGHLLLAESDVEAEQLQNFVRRQHEMGFAEVSFVDRKVAREIVPGLGEQIAAGCFSPSSGHADSRMTTRAFAAAAQRQRAVYWTNTPCLALSRVADRVVGALTSRGPVQAEQTILAAGAWSLELASSINLRLPLRVCALQALLSTPAAATLLPVVSTFRGTLSLKQQPDGAFVLGGGWPADPTPDKRSYTLRETSQQGNWDLACAVFPPLNQLRCASAWAGLQVYTPDDLPLIGSLTGLAGLTLALGSWYGFALAPTIGSAVANHLAGLPTPEINRLTPDRLSNFTPAQITAFQNAADAADESH